MFYVTLIHPDLRTPEPTKVIAEVSGRITKVYVTEGSNVHTGDPLIQLDARDLLLKKHSLETRIHFAELRHSGTAGLYHELERTNIDLGRLSITSPVDGHITSLGSFHPNDMLSPGTVIAAVAP